MWHSTSFKTSCHWLKDQWHFSVEVHTFVHPFAAVYGRKQYKSFLSLPHCKNCWSNDIHDVWTLTYLSQWLFGTASKTTQYCQASVHVAEGQTQYFTLDSLNSANYLDHEFDNITLIAKYSSSCGRVLWWGSVHINFFEFLDSASTWFCGIFCTTADINLFKPVKSSSDLDIFLVDAVSAYLHIPLLILHVLVHRICGSDCQVVEGQPDRCLLQDQEARE